MSLVSLDCNMIWHVCARFGLFVTDNNPSNDLSFIDNGCLRTLDSVFLSLCYLFDLCAKCSDMFLHDSGFLSFIDNISLNGQKVVQVNWYSNSHTDLQDNNHGTRIDFCRQIQRFVVGPQSKLLLLLLLILIKMLGPWWIQSSGKP